MRTWFPNSLKTTVRRRPARSVPLQALAAAGTDTIFTLLGINEFLPSVRLVSW